MVLPTLIAQVQAKPPVAPAERIAKDCAKAFQEKDQDWFERHIAPGFLLKGLDGDRLDRDGMLGRLHRWFHPFGYHVDASLALVSAQRTKGGLLLVSDLTVRSQPFGFRRMPLTVTTSRERSLWTPKGADWVVDLIVEMKTRKVVDGKPVAE